MKELIAVLLLLGATLAHANPIITPALGANIIGYDNERPGDFEAGATGSASLSPHVSAVGGAWYGLGESYFRGTIGARVTATDVENENFSIGIGGQYNASSEPSIRPEGWDADATVGWRPYPAQLPRIVLVAQGSYLFDPQTAYIMLGVRYLLHAF